jgi:hypothetical protein
VRPWREKAFWNALSQKGFVRDRRHKGRCYLWITLHDVPLRVHAGDALPSDSEVPL